MITRLQTVEFAPTHAESGVTLDLDLEITAVESSVLRMPYGSVRMNQLAARMPYGSVRMNQLIAKPTRA